MREAWQKKSRSSRGVSPQGVHRLTPSTGDEHLRAWDGGTNLGNQVADVPGRAWAGLPGGAAPPRLLRQRLCEEVEAVGPVADQGRADGEVAHVCQDLRRPAGWRASEGRGIKSECEERQVFNRSVLPLTSGEVDMAISAPST